MRKCILFLLLACCYASSQSQPIGTVVAWAGNPANLDPNWKICDGSQISRSKFPELCDVLQDYWGPITGNNHDLYTLPNLLGTFLRGVNQGRADKFKDPDATNREYIVTPAPASFVSNQVGSYQQSDVGPHNHEVRTNDDGQDAGNMPGRPLMYGKPEAGRVKTELNNGKETRPVNAYVYWIIRAK